MGSSCLRPFLQSLCCDSPWNYVVFWKINHQDEMALVWEDGICDIKKQRNPMSGHLYWEDPFGLAVAEMTGASHVVGKGIVGEVALDGNPCWIYAPDNIGTAVFDSVLYPEFPDEWELQFVAGIKTILLLPLIPFGVLQLGSVQMVAEDATFVAYIRNKFEAGVGQGCEWRDPYQQSSIASILTEDGDGPSTIKLLKVHEEQKNVNHSVTTNDCNLFANHVMPAVTVQNLAGGLKGTLDIIGDSPMIDRNIGQCQPSIEDDKFTETENLSKSSHFSEIRALSYCDDFENFEEFLNELVDFNFEEGGVYGHNSILNDGTICLSESSFQGFPGANEFHYGLLPTVVNNNYSDTDDSYIPSLDIAFSSIYDRETPTAVNMLGISTEEIKAEKHAKAAVLTNACSNSDNYSSNGSIMTSASVSSDKIFSTPGPSKCGASGPRSFVTTASNLSASVSSVESNDVSYLSGKRRQRAESNFVSRGKMSRLSTCNKRRGHGVDGQRTRPRDRQLIQERIKELRELVPNSGKSSIDGLLSMTINHMCFLNSITNQADKIRDQVLKKVGDENTTTTGEVNHHYQNGTSWAVELGNEQQFCPIVVKDLEHPGLMVIKMLCSDHARFLEIADVIHRLKLTILEGVMDKSCASYSWARFIVETSGSFHRLDIFWPLMQLLQQGQVPFSSKI